MAIAIVLAASGYAYPGAYSFSPGKFACHCCGHTKADPGLIRKLEVLQGHFGRDVIITSGYRCPKHNRECGGAKHSQHLFGKAADIKIHGIPPRNVARMARECGFTFIKQYRTWVHVDVR